MYQKVGNVIVRSWKMEDAASIAHYANNKKIWLNLRDSFPHPYGLKDAVAFISAVLEEQDKPYFAIATETEAIGSIGLVLGEDIHRYTAELGYWLAEPFWDKGSMTGVVKWMTTYGIDVYKLHRIHAEPYTTNKASVTVLEKAGYKCEGILKASAFKAGKNIDQFSYAYVAS